MGVVEDRWCRTEEQQAVGPVEEPVAEVSTGQDSVGAGQLGQEATHLQLEALRLTGTWRQEKNRQRVTPRSNEQNLGPSQRRVAPRCFGRRAMRCLQLVAWTFSSSLQ